jgi:hypothetical protein
MKITDDNEDLDTEGSYMWLIDQWDDGTVQRGSSGGPLFDNNKRVIGQLYTGDENIGCLNGGSLVDNTIYGRLDKSWTGGGSSSSRLSSWLGSATTTNTIRVPSISGHDLVCTSNKTFTLNNPIPGRSTSWSVSPTGLFGSSTSGSGTSATLKAASSLTTGEATLTFTMTKSGCSSVEVEYTFWVGIPNFSPTTVNGGTPGNPSVITNPASLVAVPNGGTSTATWSIATGSGSIYPSGNNCTAYAYPYVSIKAANSNSCGTGNYYLYLLQARSRVISGNPTKGIFTLQFERHFYEHINITSIQVTDQYSRPVLKLDKQALEIKQNGSIDIDLNGQAPGVYYVSIKVGENILTEKVIKL